MVLALLPRFARFACQAYAEKGVRELYPWQAAALECGADGANLVYCAPTSGGKSLVAEVLMLRALLASHRPAARYCRQQVRLVSCVPQPCHACD